METQAVTQPDRAPLVRVCVRDRGRGMAPAERQRAFEPFYTTRSAEGGTGLGLTLARAIVVQHDGKIEIDSRPGGGSSVTVDLPSASAAGR